MFNKGRGRTHLYGYNHGLYKITACVIHTKGNTAPPPPSHPSSDFSTTPMSSPSAGLHYNIHVLAVCRTSLQHPCPRRLPDFTTTPISSPSTGLHYNIHVLSVDRTSLQHLCPRRLPDFTTTPMPSPKLVAPTLLPFAQTSCTLTNTKPFFQDPIPTHSNFPSVLKFLPQSSSMRL